MYCSIREVNINYEVVGSGKPLLILNRSMKPSLEQILSDSGLKRIYVDVPGIGKTKVGEWMKSSDDVLEVILGFIDAVLGVEEFLIFGFSYCGYLVRGVLKRRSEQVAGAAFICPVITADNGKRNLPDESFVFRDEEFYASLSSCEAEELNEYIVQDQNIWSRLQQLRNSEEVCHDLEFYNRLKREGRYEFSFDTDDLPAPFEKPVLIIAGMQDGVVGYTDALRIIKNFPRAAFCILDMAGHGVHVEKEQLFLSLLRDWLDRAADKCHKIKV